MAKYSKLEVNDPLSVMVDEISEELGISTYVDFQVLTTDKGKDVCKLVKANQPTEAVTERVDLVFVILHEKAFDLVDENTQRMWIRMELEKVSYDSEKDKLNIGCPCITIPIGLAEKYGNNIIDAAKLAVYTIDQLKDAEKAEKANKKKLKKQ